MVYLHKSGRSYNHSTLKMKTSWNWLSTITGLDQWNRLVEWTTGLEYWTGLLDWTTGLEYRSGLLDWTTGLEYRSGLLDWTR